MHSKRKFKAFLGFNWHWYLIIFTAVIFAFYYLFVSLKTPSYDERISIFIGNKFVESEKLGSDLYTDFDGTEIEEVYVDYSNPADNDYAIIFNTRGMVNTDILILTKGYILDGDYDSLFVKIDQKIIDKYNIGDEKLLYDTDGLVYGIDITQYLKEYIKDDKTYYLFFNKKSEKIGYLNDNSNNDYALKILDNILG